MSDVYLVKPIAGPAGFRWRVDACTYPNSKTDSSGVRTYFGSPDRRWVATFFTREAAESFAASLNVVAP